MQKSIALAADRGLEGFDGGLQTCLDESCGPVFVDRNALGGIGGNSDICGLREVQDCIFADDFALDTSGISIQD